mgnify:CR=1 FL=1
MFDQLFLLVVSCLSVCLRGNICGVRVRLCTQARCCLQLPRMMMMDKTRCTSFVGVMMHVCGCLMDFLSCSGAREFTPVFPLFSTSPGSMVAPQGCHPTNRILTAASLYPNATGHESSGESGDPPPCTLLQDYNFCASLPHPPSHKCTVRPHETTFMDTWLAALAPETLTAPDGGVRALGSCVVFVHLHSPNRLPQWQHRAGSAPFPPSPLKTKVSGGSSGRTHICRAVLRRRIPSVIRNVHVTSRSNGSLTGPGWRDRHSVTCTCTPLNSLITSPKFD